MSQQVNGLIVKMIYLMLAGIAVTQAFSVTAVSSLLFYGVMLLTALLWISQALKRLDPVNILAVLLAILTLANVLVNAVLNAQISRLSDLTKMVSFLLAVLYFGALSDYHADRSTVRFLFGVNACLAAFWSVMYRLDWVGMHVFLGQVTQYLTFRFTNPNLTALFLLCCTMVELIGVVWEKNRGMKLVHLLLSVQMVLFLEETGSRNCLIAFLAFVLMYVLSAVSRRGALRMRRWMAAVTAIFPLLFAAAYMLLATSGLAQELFGFLVSSGKALDSRVSIWTYAWQTFTQSPIIGAFAQALHGSTQTHMHNSHLDILVSYGLPILLLFCIFLYYVLTGLRPGNSHKVCRLGIWAFAAVLLTGMGEAMLFSGGLGCYAYAGVFLLIANHDCEDISL